MFVEELDISVIDALGDLFPNLMRGSPFNHVQPGPSVLGLCPRRSSHKEVVLELSLKVVLLDMVGQCSRDLP